MEEKKLLKIKNTKHKKEILDIISYNNNNPMTANDIYLKCSNINLSTVYRILSKLVNMKIIKKTSSNDLKMYYELSNNHKHHLICDKCDSVTDIEECPTEILRRDAFQKLGFQITEHFDNLHGICGNCLKQDDSKIKK